MHLRYGSKHGKNRVGGCKQKSAPTFCSGQFPSCWSCTQQSWMGKFHLKTEHQYHWQVCGLFKHLTKLPRTSDPHASVHSLWNISQNFLNISSTRMTCPSGTLHEVPPEYRTSLPRVWQHFLLNTSWSFMWIWNIITTYMTTIHLEHFISFAWTYSIITTCMTTFPLEHFMKFLQNMKHHCHMHDNNPFWRTSLPHVCEHEVLHKVS